MPRRLLANLMSAPATELAASPPAQARVPAPASSMRRRPTDGRLYAALGGAALLIAALSLLIPSTPSYDPWAWLVWGREIVHLKLHTTGGPSWKPLPVLFTTLFAPLGKAAPDLWLVVARAGAAMAVAMVFKLSFRLTRELGSRFTAAPAELDRLSALAPAALAGLIAAVGLALSGGFVSDNALGYSEGLMTALVLIALDRHLDGKPRQAFAVGFAAALDRPEIWLFWGPYGLYLWWKDPGARKLVLGLFALIPALWFLPELWGSGHLLRGVSRAQHPRSNSPAFANCPFCTELVDHAWPTVLLRIKVAAAITVAVLTLDLWRRWRAGRLSLAAPGIQVRAEAAIVLAGLLGLGWWVVIAVMTQAGFSGNNRYLVLGAALIGIAGAAGWGWATQEVGNLARRYLRVAPVGGRARSAVGSWSAIALGVACFLLVPNWVGRNLINISRTHRALVYQAHLREDLTAVVRRYGGPGRVLACGSVMTEGFQVPMVAWTLGVHTIAVQASPLPHAPLPPAPNVILQTRAQRHSALLPVVRGWKAVPYRLAGRVRTFRLFTNCRG
ncbi:MAG: hypothetical protein JO156_10545 [Solirubrobacterales bacterium]|nr:hypothetical protein [Solirubrobacterales bacterium]